MIVLGKTCRPTNERNVKMQYFEEKIELNGFSVSLFGYVPVNPRNISAYLDRRPAVIVLPGGGYSGLANHEGEPIALRLAAQGICSFVLMYSVKPSGAVFPQALCEALTAVKFVRDHAQEYGIDPNNISTLGFSAGGHLCACTGTLWDHPCLDGYLEGNRQAYRPDKIVPCYPVISSDATFGHKGSFVNLLGRSSYEDITEEEHRLLSLENQVREGSSPAFLWTTFEDTCVPPLNAIAFASAYIRCKIPCELYMYPHGYHGIGLGDHMGTDRLYGDGYEAQEWMEKTVRFIYDEKMK